MAAANVTPSAHKSSLGCKRPRTVLDELEAEDAAAGAAGMTEDAWMRVLGSAAPASAPSGRSMSAASGRLHSRAASGGAGAPSYDAPADARRGVLTVRPGETVCTDNCAEHQEFASVELALGSMHASDTDAVEEDDAEATALTPLPREHRLKPSDYYTRFVARTAEACLAERSAPQRSDAWLDARRYSITASQFGAATGESPYQTPEDVVVDKVWNTFKGNVATEWGTEHEPHAKDAFCAWFAQHLKARGLSGEFRFIEENLLKFAAEPWMAVSPDGIVEYTGEDGRTVTELVEFKCPAYLRNTARHPYAKWTANTPSYYRAQIQGIMGYLNSHHPTWAFRRCWFVVWQPRQTWITLHEYDAEYYTSALHPALREWYFTRLLPALTHKHNGLLVRGDIHPQEPVEL